MKIVGIVLVALLTLIGSAPVSAAPIVVVGTTYDLYIAGEVSGFASDRIATFDGVAEAYMRAGLDLSLTESDADLGSGNHLISILLSANGDLFPVAFEGAVVGLGIAGNGLNFVTPVHLADARIKYYTPSGLIFTSANLADDYRVAFFSDPWTGFFAAPGGPFVNGNAGGRGINGVVFEFTVAELAQVPEPASLTLLGLGFSALTIRRRRLGRA